jgi:hypothetical protein
MACGNIKQEPILGRMDSSIEEEKEDDDDDDDVVAFHLDG